MNITKKIDSLVEEKSKVLWPGTPEYKKKFPKESKPGQRYQPQDYGRRGYKPEKDEDEKEVKEDFNLDEAQDINYHRAELKKTNDKIEAITKQGGRVGLNDPLSAKVKYHAAQIKKLKEEVEELDEIYDFPEPKSLIGKAAMHTIGAVAVGALALHQAFPSREKKPPLDHNIDKAYENKDHKLYHSLLAHKHTLLAKHYNDQAEHVTNSPSSYYKKDGQKGKKGEMKPSSRVNALYARQNAEHHEKKAAHYAEKEKSGARIDESFDFEQIDEISKKTLGSYISKASVDMANRTAEGERKRTLAGADYAHNISRGMSAKTAEAGMKKDYDAAKPDVKKAVQRMRGIDKAVGRLTK